MSSGEDTDERNPFAPPPADAPDQPWRPRTPVQPPAQSPVQSPVQPPAPGSSEDDDQPAQVPPPHPWSPGYRGGWSAPQQPQQPRFDPNDPVQRRSRYALSAGMAGLFCSVTGIQYVALLLGTLALYWAISALRAGRRAGESAAAPASPWGTVQRTRPQTPAALGGLVTGGVALLFTLSTFGLQIYYHSYLTCVSDSLTAEASNSCSNLAPSVFVQLTNPDAG